MMGMSSDLAVIIFNINHTAPYIRTGLGKINPFRYFIKMPISQYEKLREVAYFHIKDKGYALKSAV